MEFFKPCYILVGMYFWSISLGKCSTHWSWWSKNRCWISRDEISRFSPTIGLFPLTEKINLISSETRTNTQRGKFNNTKLLLNLRGLNISKWEIFHIPKRQDKKVLTVILFTSICGIINNFFKKFFQKGWREFNPPLQN